MFEREDRAAQADPQRPVCALRRMDEIMGVIARGGPVFFLDFDGTLAPIVAHADAARPLPGIAEVLARLVRRWPVVVVSGRRVEDVEHRLGVPGVVFVGDHGMVFKTPQGERLAPPVQPAHLEALGHVEQALREGLGGVAGAWVERKRCSLAVHMRQVAPGEKDRVEALVDAAMSEVEGVRKAYGKQVVEVRADVDWDKGAAVRHLLEGMREPTRGVPVVIGDDVTDEAMFRAVQGSGIAIHVRGETGDRQRVRAALGQGTCAGYRLQGPWEVKVWLERFAGLLEQGEVQGAKELGREQG